MKPAAGALLLVLLLAIPGVVLAKGLPWHSVEVQPAAPVAGAPFTVAVRLWDDAMHTRPARWWPDEGLDGRVEFQGAAERVPVTLTRTRDATFLGQVTLTEGTWRLVRVLEYAEISGPAEIELATITVAPAPTSAATPIGAAVIGVALVSAGLIWRGRRSSPPGARARGVSGVGDG
jgi:hypothetical protein